MIYYIIATLLLILQLIDGYLKAKFEHRSSAVIFIITTVFLILFSATRKDIGLDYSNYKYLYNVIDKHPFNLSELVYLNKIFNIEWTYLIICGLCKSFNIVVFIYALLGVGIKCYIIWMNCDNKYLVLFYYFTYSYLYFDMGVMRQGVAISFMLLAFIDLIKGNNKRFFVYTFIGTAFHVTAALLLPFYFVNKCRLSKNNKIIIGVPFIIAGLFGLEGTFRGAVSALGLSRIIYKLSFYDNSRVGFSLTTLIKILIFFMLLYYLAFGIQKQNQIQNETTLTETYFIGYWYGIVLIGILSFIPFLALRGTQFFSLEKYFLIDKKTEIKRIQNPFVLAVNIFFIVLAFYTMAEILPGNNGNHFQSYVPYNSYFF